ncbi:MAG: hypothetical protein U0U66_03440 [Cytophagaceae bacterium]
MFLKGLIYSLLFACFMLIGCKTAPDYPEGPTIQYKSLRVAVGTDPNTFARVDSAYITISFQDGNGDLGNEPAQSDDYFVKVYRKNAGTFTEVVFTSLDYNGKLPLLSPYSAKGPIDGTITRSITFLKPAFATGPLYPLDTVRFDVQIKDRAGNFSSWITTESFVLWK